MYFLNGGVASLTTVLLDGTMLAAATVGDEGVWAAKRCSAPIRFRSATRRCRVPDTNAERMSVEAFRHAIADRGAFRDLVGRYLHGLIGQLMQNAACR